MAGDAEPKLSEGHTPFLSLVIPGSLIRPNECTITIEDVRVLPVSGNRNLLLQIVELKFIESRYLGLIDHSGTTRNRQHK